MSFGFRDQDRQSLRDRIRGKSGDQILEELRKKLDEDKEMFFERVPNPHSFRRAGFPFDDDGLRARGRPDLKHRLEELAERHPDLADSLRPWYDQPGAGDAGGASAFHQRRDTNPFPEPTPQQRQQQQQQPQRAEAAEQPQPAPGLAQHGLRNTVDLGEAQAQAQMEGEEERGKRAQSAPPAPDQQQPQRFVSRLDINPQPGEAARPPPAGHKASANAGNVRQIPIFVEGRDEPVLARDDVDSSAANFGQGFPPMHPHSGSFAHQGFARPHMGFPSFHSRDVHDQEAPAHKRPFAQQHHQPTPPPTRHHQQPSPQPQRQKTPPQPQQPKQQPKQQQQQQPKPQPPPAQPQPPPPPPPQQQKPLDPLEKVRAVQQEVESLSKQVDEFTGTKRDKHYLFLDEMLTRELIKLDVIETEGRDDVRAARKEAIRCIQQCISRLEAKAGAENKEAMEAEPAPLAADEPMDTEPTPSASPSQPAGDNSKTEADSTSSPIPAPTPSTELVNPVPDAAVQTEETASAGLAVEATGSQSSLPSSQNMDISPPSAESVPTPAPSAPSPAGAGPVPGAEQAAPVT